MSKKVLGFYEENGWGLESKCLTIEVKKNKFIPVITVKKLEKVIKQCPCKSCDYFTEWLKELKKQEIKNE